MRENAESDIKQSPNETLAKLLAEKLGASGLISSRSSKELLVRLQNGSARIEDWRNWAEIGIAEREQEGSK